MSAKDKKKGALVPRLRFPEFRNEWTYDNLGDFLEEYSEKVNADTTLQIYSSTRDGLKAQKDYFNGHELINSGEYGVVPVNCFVYRHMSDDNIFIFNINLIGEDIAVSKEYPVFKVKKMIPLFLYYILNYGLDFKRFAAMQKKGGTRTRLYFSTLCSWKTLLPTKPEQQQIADCLSSLDERIAAETSKLDTLKDHKKGLLKQLFPAEGETLPRLRFPEFRDAGEWKKADFGKIAKFLSGGTPSKDVSEYWGGDIPWISASSMHNTKIEKSDCHITKLAISNGARIVPKGTLLLLVRGSMLHKRILLGISELDLSFNQDVKALALNADITELYLMYFLMASEPKLLAAVVQTGIGAGKLDTDDLNNFLIMMPSPIEQQRIADCLSSLDELITAQAQKIDLLKTHKKGLMQQLFPVIGEAKA